MEQKAFLKSSPSRFALLALLWVFIASSVAQGQHYIKIQSTKQLYHFFKRTPDRIPMISAHRGGPSPGFPENCIATFAHVLKQHPALLECDVRQTKDQHLVMMHDRTLGRTTNGKGKVNEHTLAALKKLKLKDNDGKLTSFGIPTLKEVLQWTRGKTILTLDIKRGVNAKKVIDAIKETKTENYVVIIVYRLEDAIKYHTLAPKLMLSVSMRNEADVKKLQASKIPLRQVMTFVGVGKYKGNAEGGYSLKINRPLIKALHALQISCTVGTMYSIDKACKEEPAIYKKILTDFEGDILATDQPTTAYTILKEVIPSTSSKQKYFKSK